MGLAIWVPSVTNQTKETEPSETRTLARGYSSLSPVEDRDEGAWKRIDGTDDLELSAIENVADCEAVHEDLLLEELKVCKYFLVILC